MKLTSKVQATCRDKVDAVASAIGPIRARKQVAFAVLDPQVQLAKRSLSVQFVTGTVVAGLLLTGNYGTAATIGAAWLFSKPATHAAAYAVGAIGTLDERLRAAIARVQAQAAPAVPPQPSPSSF